MNYGVVEEKEEEEEKTEKEEGHSQGRKQRNGVCKDIDAKC